MTNAITLCATETQGIAAAQGGGRTGKPSATTDRVFDSFKKKLEAFGAMAAPAQQAALDGGNITLNTGMQDNAEAMQAIAAAACTIEGIDLPVDPQVTANAIVANAEEAMPQAAELASASGTMAEKGENGFAVAGQDAWMQTAKPGDTPALSQDQILKSVGDHLDQALGIKDQAAEQAAPPEQALQAVPSMKDAATNAQSVSNSKPEGEAVFAGTELPQGVKSAASEARSGAEAVRGGSKEGFAEAIEKAAERKDLEKAETEEHTAPVHAQNATAEVRETAKAEGVNPSAAPETEEPQIAKENILRIVDSVSTKSFEGKHEFEVELKPEFLGKVRIKLTMEKGSIHMQIHTDDPSVRQMLSDHSPSLIGELKEKGIALTGMDISYDNPAAFNGKEQHSGSNSGGSRQGGGMNAFVQADSRTEQAWDAFSLYAGNSTVEFFA